jgi:hypothetical protein
MGARNGDTNNIVLYNTLKGMDEKLFMHHKNTVDLLLIF